jgi:hypothetical protein
MLNFYDGTLDHAQISAVSDSYWAFYLRENPESATQLGEYKYNNRVSDYSGALAPPIRVNSR